MRARTSYGSRAQSAVMPSVDAHRAERDDVLVGALVAHDADGRDRQQHGERLPDAVVEVRRARISSWTIASAARTIASRSVVDVAEDADREARARERLAPDDLLGDAEHAAELRAPRP